MHKPTNIPITLLSTEKNKNKNTPLPPPHLTPPHPTQNHYLPSFIEMASRSAV